MKQTPILFSTPMVQAILERRKKQTRRTKGLEEINLFPDLYNVVKRGLGADDYVSFVNSLRELVKVKFPYGQIGDVLWVRESYCPNYFDDKTHGYKSDWNKVAAEYVPEPKWKPSIHMPKSACRIWLKITNVRVERLKDISEEDAMSEGVEILIVPAWKNYIDSFGYCESAYESFKTLWQYINGEESWNDNPWVWVIEFELINIDK
jgi:hypothetical protein